LIKILRDIIKLPLGLHTLDSPLLIQLRLESKEEFGYFHSIISFKGTIP
jgi:hypothetical protein